MGGNKQLVGASIIALGLFLLWVFPYAEYTKIGDLNTAIEDRDQILKERTEIQDKLRLFATTYSERSVDIPTLSAVVPTKRDIAEIISAVQAMASQSGVQVLDITFSEASSQVEKQYRTMKMTMLGQGSYAGVRTLLDAIERNIRLIDVQALKLTTDQQGSQLHFEIQSDAYFLK